MNRRLALSIVLALPLAGAPLRVLILTGSSDLPYHDWRVTTPLLRSMLEATGRFEVRVLEDPARLDREALATADAVLINYNGPRWGATAEKALEEFVSSGKGVASFHLVSYCFNDLERRGGRWVRAERPGVAWETFSRLVGAFWTPEGLTRAHSPRRIFRVDVRDAEHSITRGMPAQFSLRDELYNGLSLHEGSRVLADAFDAVEEKGTGHRHPMAWAAGFGQGRVFHTTLGHDAEAVGSEGFRLLITRGVQWAASGRP